MRMVITLKVKEDAARALHAQGPHTESSSDLINRAQTLGLDIQPDDPGASDAEGQSYFHVHVADPLSVDRALAQFRSAHAVEAAFVKPPVGLA
jgi:hypothetical protein